MGEVIYLMCRGRGFGIGVVGRVSRSGIERSEKFWSVGFAGFRREGEGEQIHLWRQCVCCVVK